MTKEDVEDTSGEGEQECWYGERGCLESSEMESGSWRDCCQSGVSLAIPIYGDNTELMTDTSQVWPAPKKGYLISFSRSED